MRLWISCSVITLLLCSCSGSPHKTEHDAQQSLLSQMIYSPNGEPLNGGPLGRPTCQAALSGWFDRVDTNHNAVLSRDEFLADATAQFLRMDIDHNGYLVSEELERYRRPYRQEAAATKPASDNNAETQRNHGRRMHNSTNDPRDSASDEPAADTTDPVMAADTNLNFRVTPEEFMIHAGTVFNTLDSNQDGVVSREEVLNKCKNKP